MTIIIIAVVIIILGWFIGTMNSFNQTKVQVEESFSDVDVAVEKRFQVIKQSYASAKNYASHEQQTLLETVQYRKGMSPAELSEVNEQINKCASAINAVFESYPDLKASAVYANLQAAISETEENLAAARRIYNNNVSLYNQMLVTFPKSLVGQMFHHVKAEFFKASEAAQAGFDIPM